MCLFQFHLRIMKQRFGESPTSSGKLRFYVFVLNIKRRHIFQSWLFLFRNFFSGSDWDQFLNFWGAKAASLFHPYLDYGAYYSPLILNLCYKHFTCLYLRVCKNWPIFDIICDCKCCLIQHYHSFLFKNLVFKSENSHHYIQFLGLIWIRFHCAKNFCPQKM